jgi:DNA-binding IclR family transcriptional regulator
MLTQLISLLDNKEDGLSLFEISRQMNAQPSAVKSMLELLVQKGRLVEVGPDGKVCSTCGLEANCQLLAVRGKRFIICK